MPSSVTIPEVYVATTTTFPPDSYDAFEDTLNHLKILKPKIYAGGNVEGFCAAILVYDKRLDSYREFKLKHLVYITCIFEDNSDYKFCIWDIHKYKEFTKFIKTNRAIDLDVIQPQYIITHESLFQKSMREYCNLFDPNYLEYDVLKDKSQYQNSHPKYYIVAIDQSTNKALKKIDFYIHRSGNANETGGGFSVSLNVTCNKCVKKGHINRYCRFNIHFSSGDSYQKSRIEILVWFTKKPVVSDFKDLATSNMTRNRRKYNWCTYWDNGNGAWGFHWKDGNK